MNRILLLIITLIFSKSLSAQDFTGQWKGQFTDNSTSFTGWGGDKCDYVLELECKGKTVTGYSYTYFSDGGKRFYTICKLSGTINKASKYIEVRETERTKTNVPVNIRNCFQVHRLTYFQKGDEQTLEGTWVPAPNQQGDCGYGTTLLSRRLLKNTTVFNTNRAKNTLPKPKKITEKAKPNTETAKTQINTEPDEKVIAKKPGLDLKKENLKVEEAIPEEKNSAVTEKAPAPSLKFEKRSNDLLKTIEIESDTFKVVLYDNGEVDGDSISLFFNGRLILSHSRLSEKPINLYLQVDKSKDVNELVMYAENLGTIPPNTALMVVTDGENRYEVRISSDLKKSGVIRFVYKPKKTQ